MKCADLELAEIIDFRHAYTQLKETFGDLFDLCQLRRFAFEDHAFECKLLPHSVEVSIVGVAIVRRATMGISLVVHPVPHDAVVAATHD